MSDHGHILYIFKSQNQLYGINGHEIDSIEKLESDELENLDLRFKSIGKLLGRKGPEENKIKITSKVGIIVLADELIGRSKIPEGKSYDHGTRITISGNSCEILRLILIFSNKTEDDSQEKPSTKKTPSESKEVKEQKSRLDKSLKREERIQKSKRLRARFVNKLRSLFQSVSFRIAAFLLAFLLIAVAGILLFEPGDNSQFENVWDGIWYAIVTITTVGYGDKAPITVGGKIVGLFLMAIGVVVLAAVTGQIASYFVEQQMKRREGLISVKRVKNHFIICGWRKELEKVIDGVLQMNPQLDTSDIVLINNVNKEELQPILGDPKYENINYIHGEYIQEETLLRGNIKEAKNILVLADFSSNFSLQEVDSRTVMTVLTIESLNKKIYVCAELLDAKFEKFLKLANCDEIILSREYTKMILANASTATGVSQVIGDLLSTEAGQGIQTMEIPVHFLGKSFKELSSHFQEKTGAITIGVLENTGNFYKRKKEALNEAQMTPDISKLVENLQNVKQLVPNKSVLNPGADYIIRRNTKAIVIESTAQ